MITSSLIVITFLFIVGVLLIRRLLKWRNRRLMLSLLPGPKRQHIILGDLSRLIGRSKADGVNFHVLLLQSLLGVTRLYRNDGLCRLWFANDPYVLFFSAETLEPILTSQTTIEKAHIYDSSHCWLKEGLLTSSGKKWKERRKLLTPTFHYRILDEFVPIFEEHSKELIKNMNTFAEKEWIDIYPIITIFTLQIICETAMGIKTDCNEAEFAEYVDAVATFGDIIMKKFAKPWLQNDFIFSLTSDYLTQTKVLNILHGFTSKVVKRKRQELLDKISKCGDQTTNKKMEDDIGIKRKQIFLDLLLQIQLNEGSLSEEDICEEVNTFMFAGHDTTSAGISWALYHLGRHPDVQEKIYMELKEILGDDKSSPITLKDINQMKYLERVLKECQRISPSVPMIARIALEDINIKGYTIPKETSLLLFISSLHMDPNVYPDPEIFDPDRFLSENSVKRHPFSYIPFSAGSRNCLGQRFAMMEMKITLCNIIRNFVLESLDPLDRVLATALMILKPVNGLRLKIRKRE